jgi:hypothetical protein
MTKRKLSSREKTLIMIAAAVLLFYTYYSFIISPLNNEVTEIRSDIDQSILVLRKQGNLLAKKNSLLAEYKMVSKKQKEATQYTSVVDMTEDIQRIASGILQPNSIRPVEQALDREKQSKFALEMEIISDFESILKFMYKLEKEDSRLLISRMNLNVISGHENQISAKLFVESIQ